MPKADTGLSVEEILALTDKELNQVRAAGLKSGLATDVQLLVCHAGVL